ncbi:MAG: S41 family peptidase, partial [bacterium]|nr:S41 family peptidase [bacterium]
REGSEEVIELTIERDTITTTSVSWRMIDDTIAYVMVTSFSADTLDQLNQAITELLVEEPAGLILDLRGNPGGFLDVAVEFTGEFIDGQIVVIEKFGEGEQIEHSSERPSRLPDIDTVVLVNHGTASASEIVAGALQDYERAIVIGEQTFGKGSVQDYTEFEDGSSLKLTVAEWLTPDGRSINETGITPDQMVELTADDFQASNDTQLNAAIEFLNNQ